MWRQPTHLPLRINTAQNQERTEDNMEVPATTKQEASWRHKGRYWRGLPSRRPSLARRAHLRVYSCSRRGKPKKTALNTAIGLATVWTGVSAADSLPSALPPPFPNEYSAVWMWKVSVCLPQDTSGHLTRLVTMEHGPRTNIRFATTLDWGAGVGGKPLQVAEERAPRKHCHHLHSSTLPIY